MKESESVYEKVWREFFPIWEKDFSMRNNLYKTEDEKVEAEFLDHAESWFKYLDTIGEVNA